MARPREFNEAQVLDAAMNCFWSQGYAATSVRDLADEMGITGASLYNAFGDKKALYRRAFEHYLELSVHDRVRRLDARPGYDAIRAFFGEITHRSVSDRKRRGCLLVNSAVELAPHDAAFRKIVAQEFVLIEAFFHRCVVAGQKEGTISTVQPADELAKVLLGMLLGLRVLARTRPQASVLEGAANTALALLRARSAQVGAE